MSQNLALKARVLQEVATQSELDQELSVFCCDSGNLGITGIADLKLGLEAKLFYQAALAVKKQRAIWLRILKAKSSIPAPPTG